MPNADAAQDDELVSVICRTIGRAELDQAIESVAAQDYPAIELILVDAAAKGLRCVTDKHPQLNCHQVSRGTALGRSEAANSGMEAAAGEWFLFLDDDDWIAPDHISSLVSAVRGQSKAKAVYSDTVKTTQEGEQTGYRFEQDFDPVLLMRDNYIPIHAMLFHHSLYEAGCLFDTQFDIYEDWDFWLQLAQHTEFLHVAKATAFYREGGESETAIDDVAERYKDDNDLGIARSRLLGKWMQRWTGAQLNALLGSLDQSQLIAQLQKQLEAEHETNLQNQDQIREQIVQIDEKSAQLEVLRNQLNAAKADIEHRDTLISELQRRIEELLNSTSWRLTAPVRNIANLVRGTPQKPQKNPDKFEDKPQEKD